MNALCVTSIILLSFHVSVPCQGGWWEVDSQQNGGGPVFRMFTLQGIIGKMQDATGCHDPMVGNIRVVVVFYI